MYDVACTADIEYKAKSKAKDRDGGGTGGRYVSAIICKRTALKLSFFSTVYKMKRLPHLS